MLTEDLRWARHWMGDRDKMEAETPCPQVPVTWERGMCLQGDLLLPQGAGQQSWPIWCCAHSGLGFSPWEDWSNPGASDSQEESPWVSQLSVWTVTKPLLLCGEPGLQFLLSNKVELQKAFPSCSASQHHDPEGKAASSVTLALTRLPFRLKLWTPGLFTVPGAGASQSSCLGAHWRTDASKRNTARTTGSPHCASL